ncbi:MAG: dynamin family protein [Culicoidibacterales bacterium]
MKKVVLNYSPYQLKTVITIGGTALENSHRLMKFADKRLQYYLEAQPGQNWAGIVGELKKEINDRFELKFVGRALDFTDLQLVVNGDKDITLVHEQKYNDAEALSFVEEIYKECQNGAITELKSDDIKKAYSDAKSSIFKVGVVATMSSGKSTFINSMLGQELLPSKNAACTATITSILDTNDEKPFEVECFDKNGQQVTGKQLATAEDLEAYNDDSDIARIKLYGDILSLSSESMDIELYDTPGPNNAQDTDHGKTTQAFINDKDQGVIIYLMDATSFGTNDDKGLLERISDAMKEADKQQSDRFLFVLNKCDALDHEKGETIEKLIENARAYLATFGIHHANIFPVTAELAKVARMHQNAMKLTLSQKRTLRSLEDVLEYEELQFDTFATLSPSVRQELNQLKIKALQELKNDNEEAECDLALIFSGIKGVELTIKEYLDKYAVPLKIKKMLNTFNDHIVAKMNDLNLEERIASSESERKEIQKEIQTMQVKHQKSEGGKELLAKIDQLTIDQSIFKKANDEANKKIAEITRKYAITKNEKLLVNEAESLNSRMTAELQKIQKEIYTEVELQIEKRIHSEAKKIIKDYQKLVGEIASSFEINGFNFQKSILYRRNSAITNDAFFIEEVERIEAVDNPDKRWYKFWEPTTIEKVHIDKYDYVDFVKQVRKSTAEVGNDARANINLANEKASKQLQEIKKHYSDEVIKLEAGITEMLIALGEKANDSQKIAEELAQNKHKNEQLKALSEKIQLHI